MTIDLYYAPISSQSQAIQMVAAAIDVPLNLIAVNLMAGEHLKPEFVAINPQHTIPTLHDNGFAVWETRAILTYLVEKYGPAGGSLFPAGDVAKRALINQRLYFDMGTLYRAFTEAYFPQFFRGVEPSAEALQKVRDAFGFLDIFLASSQFVAGDVLTVADFALFTTASLYELIDYDWSEFKNVAAWYGRLRQSIPGEKINAAGLEAMRAFIKSRQEKK